MVRRRKRRRRYTKWFLVLALAAVAVFGLKYRDLAKAYLPMNPPGIVLHHSASPPSVGGRIIDAAAIDQMHAHRGFGKLYRGKTYHIGYHFVILPDGTVQEGRPIGCRGAHTDGQPIYNQYIGICLVGNFSSRANRRGFQGPKEPTKAQMDALVGLCRRLMSDYGIRTSAINRHRDLNQTECPGDGFPFEWLLSRLDQE